MKLNGRSEKYSENINQGCDVPKIIVIENKVYDNYNKVSYLQRNKKCHSMEITFHKKVNISQ